jgi:hypothetical protein
MGPLSAFVENTLVRTSEESAHLEEKLAVLVISEAPPKEHGPEQRLE